MAKVEKTLANGQTEVRQKQKKETKKVKTNKQAQPKRSRVKETMSELKKVSKPTFGKVVKNTCVVIAVVAICTLLLFGMDKLFSLVYDLLLP